MRENVCNVHNWQIKAIWYRQTTVNQTGKIGKPSKKLYEEFE